MALVVIGVADKRVLNTRLRALPSSAETLPLPTLPKSTFRNSRFILLRFSCYLVPHYYLPHLSPCFPLFLVTIPLLARSARSALERLLNASRKPPSRRSSPTLPLGSHSIPPTLTRLPHALSKPPCLFGIPRSQDPIHHRTHAKQRPSNICNAQRLVAVSLCLRVAAHITYSSGVSAKCLELQHMQHSRSPNSFRTCLPPASSSYRHSILSCFCLPVRVASGRSTQSVVHCTHRNHCASLSHCKDTHAPLTLSHTHTHTHNPHTYTLISTPQIALHPVTGRSFR